MEEKIPDVSNCQPAAATCVYGNPMILLNVHGRIEARENSRLVQYVKEKAMVARRTEIYTSSRD